MSVFNFVSCVQGTVRSGNVGYGPRSSDVSRGAFWKVFWKGSCSGHDERQWGDKLSRQGSLSLTAESERVSQIGKTKAKCCQRWQHERISSRIGWVTVCSSTDEEATTFMDNKVPCVRASHVSNIFMVRSEISFSSQMRIDDHNLGVETATYLQYTETCERSTGIARASTRQSFQSLGRHKVNMLERISGGMYGLRDKRR